jgi:hypothetical protein
MAYTGKGSGLTMILDEELRKAGYYLEEDDHLVILKRQIIHAVGYIGSEPDEIIVGRFSIHGTIEEIRATAKTDLEFSRSGIHIEKK